jgi:hypothetical protein
MSFMTASVKEVVVRMIDGREWVCRLPHDLPRETFQVSLIFATDAPVIVRYESYTHLKAKDIKDQPVIGKTIELCPECGQPVGPESSQPADPEGAQRPFWVCQHCHWGWWGRA